MSKNTANRSEDARRNILDAALHLAPFEGWTSQMLANAVNDAKLPAGAEELYFPGGPLELIEFWNAECDAYVRDKLAELDIEKMRIRDKVTTGVLARFEAIGPHEDAARRAVARTALPDGLTMSPKILWAAADTIWRAIGDLSTDFNFYTKRTTLSAVISTSLAAWLADQEPEKQKAKAFLDARIENVMQFEKAKYQVKKTLDVLPDPAEIIGKIRHGGRRRRRRS
jgi:ubiquinone biosynthesis protein COQ9